MRIGCDAPGATVAASGKENGLRAEHVHRAVGNLVADDAGALPTFVRLATLEDEIHNVILVVELHARLNALLVERLQNHVARAVCGVAASADWPLAVVARVPAEAALVNLAVGGSIEWEAHALQFDHRGDGLTCQHFSGILIGKIVTTLDGVEHVPLPVVLFYISEGRTDTTLCRTGVRTGWIQLGQDGSGDSFTGELECSPEACAASAHNDGINVDVGGFGAQPRGHFSGSVSTTLLPSTTSTAARIQSRVSTTCCAVPLR